MTRRDNTRPDAGDLFRRLALAKNHLGKALPGGSMVIDPREAQILKGRLAYKLKEAVLCGLRRKRASLDGLEKRA